MKLYVAHKEREGPSQGTGRSVTGSVTHTKGKQRTTRATSLGSDFTAADALKIS